MRIHTTLGKPAFLCLLILLSGVFSHHDLLGLEGEKVRDEEVAVLLVSPMDQVRPGDSFYVGVEFRINPGWHTYWINAGDTGREGRVQWNIPDGVEVGELIWPHPEVYRNNHLVDYVYEDEVILYAEFTLSEDWEEGKKLEIAADVDWLMCEKICIPGKATVTLEIPVGSEKKIDSKQQEKFEQTRQLWPAAAEELSYELYHSGERLQLLIRGFPDAADLAEDTWFFAIDPVVSPGADQTIHKNEEGDILLETRISEYAGTLGETVRGVLVNSKGWSVIDGRPALAIAATVNEGRVSDFGGTVEEETTPLSLGLLLLAFGGGLILNLMPCVFPVLGIKIMGFVQQSGQSRGKVVSHGLLFTAGVLVSFWILAGALLALRAGGSELGWGFQLQSPTFVFGIAIFLLLFALNLSGLFEIGFKLATAGGKYEGKSGWGGSFLSGILATIVATPCSAPILATALAGALTLAPMDSLLAFTAIALGLATPYLVLSLFPALVRMLPKPGAWMETMKQFLAFPLYATVGWLMYVFAGQVSGDQLLDGLLALTLIAMAAWIYGKYSKPHLPSRTRSLGWIGAILALTGGIALGLPQESEITWETWSPERVEALQEENRWIYVDYTARWCATCQVNKKVVFSSEEVLNFIRENDVALLKADWTNEDPVITRSLAGFGKAAVPVNLIYAPGESEPAILPETLTPGIVMRYFNDKF